MESLPSRERQLIRAAWELKYERDFFIAQQVADRLEWGLDETLDVILSLCRKELLMPNMGFATIPDTVLKTGRGAGELEHAYFFSAPGRVHYRQLIADTDDEIAAAKKEKRAKWIGGAWGFLSGVLITAFGAWLGAYFTRNPSTAPSPTTSQPASILPNVSPATLPTAASKPIGA